MTNISSATKEIHRKTKHIKFLICQRKFLFFVRTMLQYALCLSYHSNTD